MKIINATGQTILLHIPIGPAGGIDQEIKVGDDPFELDVNQPIGAVYIHLKEEK